MCSADVRLLGGGTQIEVVHETIYRYQSGVELAQHLAMLQPRDDGELQRLLHFEMQIQPTPQHRHGAIDSFGNPRCWFSIVTPHSELRVKARSLIELGAGLERDQRALLPVLAWEAAAEAGSYRAGAAFDASDQFRFASPLLPAAVLADPALLAFARRSFWPGRPLVDAALDLMHGVNIHWRYQPQSTTVATPVLQAFAQREGVCQDFAHLMIAMLRSLGLAARYVSGYLVDAVPQAASASDALAGAAVPTAMVGAGASHAWVALALPMPDGSTHWLELDPTNDCIAAADHLRLAYGRDYGDVAPLRGVIRGGGAHTPSVRVQTRLIADTAVTGDYRLAQSLQA